MICLRHVYDVSSTCLRCVLDVSSTCLRCIYDMSMICLRHVLDMSSTYPRHVLDMSWTFLSLIYCAKISHDLDDQISFDNNSLGNTTKFVSTVTTNFCFLPSVFS